MSKYLSKEIIGFLVISIFGIYLTKELFLIENDNLNNLFKSNDNSSKMKSYNGVALNTDNAPNLTDLFPGNDKGPHQKFISPESCLKCHASGVDIPGVGKAPKILHEPQQFCTSCHLLPDS
tara:strand:+ start:151 stop:513 length:363 start_codon:yes stop_codon:yes gene_type:complete